MECKLLNEFDGIAVGDIVKVVKEKEFYTTHGELWLDYYGLDKDKFLSHSSNIANDIIHLNIEGKVLAIGKHLDDKSDFENDMLFYVDFGEENLVCSIDGLKLISKANPKNHYRIIDKVKHFYINE